MALIPESVQSLIDAFSRLPGIGPRTASRLTYFLLKNESDVGEELADALTHLKSDTTYCPECFNIMSADKERCDVCSSSGRDEDLLCVVESPMDVIVIEQSGGYFGKYHVLHGALSPIAGIHPEDLRLQELFERIEKDNFSEVIIATNPSMEGDATALYIRKKLENKPIRFTRLARGLPVGGELEYADPNTLLRALSGRQNF